MPVPKDPEKYALFIERQKKAQQRRRDNPENAQRNAEEKEARKRAMQRPEVREKLSNAAKIRASRPGEKEARSIRAKEAMNRVEVKQKCSEVRKTVWQQSEARTNYEKGHAERWSRPGEREKISEATKAAMIEVRQRPDYIEAVKTGIGKWWSDPQNREKRLAQLYDAAHTPESLEKWSEAMSKMHRYRGRTSIEIIVASVLDMLNVEYEEQKRINRYIADFYVPSKNLIIECDGDYWHNRKPGAIEKDARKTAHLVSHGYTVLRLPEQQIRSGELDALYNALADNP